MGEEIKPGQKYREIVTVLAVSADRVHFHGKATGMYYQSRDEFQQMIQDGELSLIEVDQPHIYTAADIERIVAIAAKKQRYKCLRAIRQESGRVTSAQENAVLDAPAPSAADVLAEFEKGNGEKNAD